MNRDEAERCLDIAHDAEKQGNIEKALKFYEKSMRLNPNSVAEAAIDRLKQKTQSNNTSNEPNLRQRSSQTSSSNSESENNSSKKYTNEQQASCARIIKCTDYYEILSVSKTSTEEEIKRSYKKLALQMHPDKNQAPGAEEAFKKIGQAFSCLSDPQKRKLYDVRGSEEPTSPSMRTRHEWDSELTPEEIFSMFFGGGIPVRRSAGGNSPFFRTYSYSTPRGFRRDDSEDDIFTHQRPRRTTTRQQTPVDVSPIYSLLQFLPLLLLIFYIFFSSPSEPNYSFKMTEKYSNEMQTAEHSFKYYVKPDFDFKTKSNVDKLVEKTWINHLQEECYSEMQYAKRYRTKTAMKNCEELDKKQLPRPRW